MKFCWCTIQVRNLEESLKFYQGIVGLTVNRRFGAPSGTEIAFLGSGDTEIELLCNAENKELAAGQNISLGFEVKSVEDMMAFVKEQGIALHSGPFMPNSHIRFFYVLDPNGVKIQFVENIA
jgi:lactoylglutathione lyase